MNEEVAAARGKAVGAGRPQRSTGGCVLAYARRDGRTRLADLGQHPPCRVLFPHVPAGEPPLAALVTTTGGLTGGDRLDLAIGVGEGAAATVTGQAAEKIYRSAGGAARIDVGLSAGPGGWLEWLPQETILFDGAALHRATGADLDPTARLLACEIVVFGRRASGEEIGRLALADTWRLRIGGRLAWADGLALGGVEEPAPVVAGLADPLAFAGAGACATVVYAGPDAEAALPTARALLASAGPAAGVTRPVPGVLVARVLAPDGATARRRVARLAAGLRAAMAGLPARMPGLWFV
ncbi:MAG: urease accessory protein UreD [Azospirillaceae bacterium]